MGSTTNSSNFRVSNTGGTTFLNLTGITGISVAGDTPTWGGMIVEGRQIVYQAPWIMAFPILSVIVSVIGFNLLGDGLRAALDPVQRR